MPSLDWTIVRSLLLQTIVPSFLTAVGILGCVTWSTQSKFVRSIGGAVAFLVSIIVVNSLNNLVPLIALKSSVVTESHDASAIRWELETGWYSLVTVTIIAVVFEVIFDSLSQRKLPKSLLLGGAVIVALALGCWITPSDLIAARPIVGLLMAAAILLNTVALKNLESTDRGFANPLLLAVVWGGSVMMVAVLSHSARFADMSMMLSCALAAVGLMNWMTRQGPVSCYSGPATFIPGLMLETTLNTYSEIPSYVYAMIALAPLAVFVCAIPGLKRRTEPRPELRLIPLAVPCAIAVSVAVWAEILAKSSNG